MIHTSCKNNFRLYRQALYYYDRICRAFEFSITVDPFFLGLVLQLDYMFESRYFIPITGIIMGNCLKTNIIALNAYYTELPDHDHAYHIRVGIDHSDFDPDLYQPVYV